MLNLDLRNDVDITLNGLPFTEENLQLMQDDEYAKYYVAAVYFNNTIVFVNKCFDIKEYVHKIIEEFGNKGVDIRFFVAQGPDTPEVKEEMQKIFDDYSGKIKFYLSDEKKNEENLYKYVPYLGKDGFPCLPKYFDKIPDECKVSFAKSIFDKAWWS